jgi:hypothetical protein
MAKFIKLQTGINQFARAQLQERNYVLSQGFNPVTKLIALKGVSVASVYDTLRERREVLDPIVSIN